MKYSTYMTLNPNIYSVKMSQYYIYSYSIREYNNISIIKQERHLLLTCHYGGTAF